MFSLSDVVRLHPVYTGCAKFKPPNCKELIYRQEEEEEEEEGRILYNVRQRTFLYRITNEYRSYETGNDAFSIAACKGSLYYRVSAVACFLSCHNKPVSLIATIMIQCKIII